MKCHKFQTSPHSLSTSGHNKQYDFGVQITKISKKRDQYYTSQNERQEGATIYKQFGKSEGILSAVK